MKVAWETAIAWSLTSNQPCSRIWVGLGFGLGRVADGALWLVMHRRDPWERHPPDPGSVPLLPSAGHMLARDAWVWDILMSFP